MQYKPTGEYYHKSTNSLNVKYVGNIYMLTSNVVSVKLGQ